MSVTCGKHWNYTGSKDATRERQVYFAVQEIEFVGHLISPKGHRPLPAVVQRIREYPAPSSLRELKSFLGLINYSLPYTNLRRKA